MPGPDAQGLDLLLRAVSFAGERHDGQMRKDGKTPYFAHPVRVMTIAAQVFGVSDPEVLAAAVLHDTVEDTDADRDDIASRFGERVAGYVVHLTKDKRLPEAEREERYFASLAAAPVEVKLCKMSDTIDNLIDSRGLSAAHRAKTLAKAKRLVDAFGGRLPSEWVHALDRLRDEVRRAEA